MPRKYINPYGSSLPVVEPKEAGIQQFLAQTQSAVGRGLSGGLADYYKTALKQYLIQQELQKSLGIQEAVGERQKELEAIKHAGKMEELAKKQKVYNEDPVIKTLDRVYDDYNKRLENASLTGDDTTVKRITKKMSMIEDAITKRLQKNGYVEATPDEVAQATPEEMEEFVPFAFGLFRRKKKVSAPTPAGATTPETIRQLQKQNIERTQKQDSLGILGTQKQDSLGILGK